MSANNLSYLSNMKLLELPEFSSSTSRNAKIFRRRSPRGVNGAVRNLSPDGTGRRNTGGKTVLGRIQNFFYFAPDAKTVQLAGDFTNWQERPVSLRKGADGLWWAAVRLEVGTHYYRFLVDGQWRDDPDCPLVVPNPFGSLNAVRQVYW